MKPTEARAFARSLPSLGPTPPIADERDLTLSVSGGTIAASYLSDTNEPQALIVYLHGGGWVIGDITDFTGVGRRLAKRSRSAVLLVDYRKAPEYRYPTAVEDATAALDWAAHHLERLTGSTSPALVVAGDSSGGNLAAAVAQRWRAGCGQRSLSAQILVYPVLDHRMQTASYRDPANQLLLTRELMEWYWDHYAPVREHRAHPRASPGLATELADLPPAIVVTAEHDVLRDEGEAYVQSLAAAGVAVRHTRMAGSVHGFLAVETLCSSDACLAFVSDELLKLLDVDPTAG
jgi:acetyl esterase